MFPSTNLFNMSENNLQVFADSRSGPSASGFIWPHASSSQVLIVNRLTIAHMGDWHTCCLSVIWRHDLKGQDATCKTETKHKALPAQHQNQRSMTAASPSTLPNRTAIPCDAHQQSSPPNQTYHMKD